MEEFDHDLSIAMNPQIVMNPRRHNMEAKHTPGQVKVLISQGDDIEYRVFIHSQAGNLAQMFLVEGLGVTEANARRIMLTWNTHDDLLAALEEAEYALSLAANLYAATKSHHSSVLEGRLAIVRQAISKAKGSAPASQKLICEDCGGVDVLTIHHGDLLCRICHLKRHEATKSGA